jgi:uncharacterized protein YndB with AHSA1/START domain
MRCLTLPLSSALAAKNEKPTPRRNSGVSIFKTSREIPASPQEIYEAFRNPEFLARWWGPEGFTNTFNVFQFENGGKWSFVMHGPDGKSYSNENEFVELVNGSKVVIRHVSEPKFILTVNLKSCTEGSVVTWVQEFENEQVAKNIAHIVEPSNEQNLDRLTAVIRGS